jgi:hypothetical protein
VIATTRIDIPTVPIEDIQGATFGGN